MTLPAAALKHFQQGPEETDMRKPFAITLDVGSSRANHTGAWRTERPVYVHNLPPCNSACPAGENIQQWLYDAEEGSAKYEGWQVPVDAAPTGKRVLVVGAGPSGLSAAYHLTRLGHCAAAAPGGGSPPSKR